MDSNSLMIVIGIGYLLGSLPYGLILVKIFHGIDIRTIGSGNIGATNVLRAGYKWLALITLFLDAFKGAIAVLIVKYYLGYKNDYVALAGLASIMGHMYPIWLGFKGGKGVATFFGIILAFNPVIFLISGLTWLVSAFITRYSSLSALLAVIIFPISCYFLDRQFLSVAIVIAIMILYKHKDNIKRLMSGQESKINFKK